MGDQDGQAMPSDLSAEDTAGLSSYEGSDTDMGDQPGDSFDSAPGGGEGQSGASAQGAAQRGDQGGDEASRGAGAGGGQGGPDAARPQDGRSPTGKVLELRGRPSDGGGPGLLDDNGKVPLVASNDGSIGGVGDSAGRAIVDPLSIRGEQNFVPWEKRQIVRDFFTGTGK